MFVGLAIGGISIRAVASSYLAQGTSQTSGCLLFVVGTARAAPHCFLCSLLCFVWQFGGFLNFLAFCPFFRFCSFLEPVLCPQALVEWRGITGGGDLYWVGSLQGVCECLGGSPLFPILSFVTVGHWVIGRPRNGSRGGLLQLLLYRFLGFLFWHV